MQRASSTCASRAAWTALWAMSVALLGALRVVGPDTRGFGTHERLGLPPCGFASATGIPCPGCGLTTSLAHMARAQIGAALATHLAGPALFLMLAWVVLFAPIAIARRRPVSMLATSRSFVALAWSTVVLTIAAFVLRVHAA